jgi:hypothetical protein
MIEPQHLLLALLQQEDGSTSSLLARRRPARGAEEVHARPDRARPQGKLDPVIGRDDEIRRAIQVLQRRTKNNPVLIGEPGVGKTAIVEGPGAAHRQRRSARDAEGQARAGRSTWRRCWPAPSTAASSRSA